MQYETRYPFGYTANAVLVSAFTRNDSRQQAA